MGPKQENAEVYDLDTEKSRKFLELLRDHPFVTLVMIPNGTVEIFSKGINGNHVSRLRDILLSLEHGEKPNG